MEYKVGPIRKIHQQLILDGYQVSEYSLRRWIKQGTLPAVYTGSKALISYDRVIALLNATSTVVTG